MTKQEEQKILKEIDDTLAITQWLWKVKDVSHAHIIGYLESALKQIKEDIEGTQDN